MTFMIVWSYSHIFAKMTIPLNANLESGLKRHDISHLVYNVSLKSVCQPFLMKWWGFRVCKQLYKYDLFFLSLHIHVSLNILRPWAAASRVLSLSHFSDISTPIAAPFGLSRLPEYLACLYTDDDPRNGWDGWLSLKVHLLRTGLVVSSNLLTIYLKSL